MLDIRISGSLEMATSVPWVIEPDFSSMAFPEWLSGKVAVLSVLLREHGAVLFRGFRPIMPPEFDVALKRYSGPSFDYEFRSNDRSRIAGNVFSSTEFPASEVIPFHNEMSYYSTWPDRLWLYCMQPSETGGSTPLADSRKVLASIPREIRDRFIGGGVTYLRNMREDLDVPWQEVFQTEDRERVRAYCEQNDIRFEWVSADHLRTWQWRPATHRHPVTGEEVWFNQAHLFHYTARGSEVGDWLLRHYGSEGLPRNAYIGDSEPISMRELDEIREAYERNRIEFEWQAGDILVIDNVLMAHARQEFTGQRQIVVGLTGVGE